VRYAFSQGPFRGLVGDPNAIGTETGFSTGGGQIYIHELGIYVGGGLRF
jgi:hypothetical protein